MAITFVAAGAALSAVSGNLVNLASAVGTVDKDVEVMVIVARDNVVVTLPAGWAKKAELNSTATIRLTIAWRRFATGDATTTTVTHAAGSTIRGRIYNLRGVKDTGDPFEATITRANASVGGVGTNGALNLTTLTANTKWLHALGSADDFATAFSSSSPAGLTNIVERDEWEVTAGAGSSGAFYEADKVTAGVQTGLAITWGPTAAAASAEWAGALTEAPSGTSEAISKTVSPTVANLLSASVGAATSVASSVGRAANAVVPAERTVAATVAYAPGETLSTIETPIRTITPVNPYQLTASTGIARSIVPSVGRTAIVLVPVTRTINAVVARPLLETLPGASEAISQGVTSTVTRSVTVVVSVDRTIGQTQFRRPTETFATPEVVPVFNTKRFKIDRHGKRRIY